jgi:predicted Rossmann fold nucleotide-binding protein DprA/Smf involved in DNA uptake
MVLKRSQSYFKLHFTGRDVIEDDIELELDKDTCLWKYRGISSPDSTPERQEILDILTNSTIPVALKEIADRLGKTTQNINILLKKLIEEGHVRKERTGYYTIVI